LVFAFVHACLRVLVEIHYHKKISLHIQELLSLRAHSNENGSLS
jgi:hypothetical protein